MSPFPTCSCWASCCVPRTNSGTPSYAIIADKLEDAHDHAGGGVPGVTCCSDLRSPTFNARTRIDVVFFRGAVRAETLEIVGTDQAKRTPSGLWPSDHAGVVATLAVGR